MPTDQKVSDFGDGVIVGGEKIYGTRSGADTGLTLGGAAGKDTGYFVSDTGAFFSDTGYFVSDTGTFLSDTGQFPAAASSVIGKQSIWVPAAAMTPATTSGATSSQTEEATNAHNYTSLDFDASSDEYACFEILMPDGWDRNSLTYKAAWSSTAADTDGVSWGLQAVAVADGDDSDVAYGAAIVVDDANQSNAGDILISGESMALTVAGSPGAGDLVQFRVFRDVSDANDTATEDARLRGIYIYYTLSSGVDG